jgi:hypothetical protein
VLEEEAFRFPEGTGQNQVNPLKCERGDQSEGKGLPAESTFSALFLKAQVSGRAWWRPQ